MEVKEVPGALARKILVNERRGSCRSVRSTCSRLMPP